MREVLYYGKFCIMVLYYEEDCYNSLKQLISLVTCQTYKHTMLSEEFRCIYMDYSYIFRNHFQMVLKTNFILNQIFLAPYPSQLHLCWWKTTFSSCRVKSSQAHPHSNQYGLYLRSLFLGRGTPSHARQVGTALCFDHSCKQQTRATGWHGDPFKTWSITVR